MNRADLVQFETMCRDLYRREARRRAKRYPAAAEQLNRWADAADARIEAIRCGPLFDSEAPAEGLQPIGPTIARVAEDVIERAKGRAA